LALNKIDAVNRETVDLEALATQLNHLSYAPVFVISAVTHTGLEPMLQEIWGILDQMKVPQEVEVFL
jgi:GTP-binding protein